MKKYLFMNNLYIYIFWVNFVKFYRFFHLLIFMEFKRGE